MILTMSRSWLYSLVLPTALPALSLASDVATKVRTAVQAHDSAAQVTATERSPVSGLYLTSIDGVSGYVSSDGRYFIVGDMLDLASRSNVTEERRQAKRRSVLQQIA